MHQFIILCLFRGAEETDLIYEGIETFPFPSICGPIHLEETDLIYEGIETS